MDQLIDFLFCCEAGLLWTVDHQQKTHQSNTEEPLQYLSLQTPCRHGGEVIYDTVGRVVLMPGLSFLLVTSAMMSAVSLRASFIPADV